MSECVRGVTPPDGRGKSAYLMRGPREEGRRAKWGGRMSERRMGVPPAESRGRVIEQRASRACETERGEVSA